MSSTKLPLVTIGLPVFNGEAFLDRAIQSLLNQEFYNFKLIIADNCSTDNTSLICKKYSEKDSRIEYFRHIENRGASYNFQFVLDQAKTEYFMWANHDDYWFPNFIKELVSILDANNDCIIAFPLSRYIDEEGHFLKQNSCLSKTLQPSHSEKWFNNSLRNSSFYKFLFADISSGKLDLSYGLFRKNKFNNSNLVSKWEDILWGGDILIIAEILMHGNAYFIDVVLMEIMDRKNSSGVHIDKTRNFVKIVKDTLSTVYLINIWATRGHSRLFELESRFQISKLNGYFFIFYQLLKSNFRMLKVILKEIFNRLLLRRQ